MFMLNLRQMNSNIIKNYCIPRYISPYCMPQIFFTRMKKSPLINKNLYPEENIYP